MSSSDTPSGPDAPATTRRRPSPMALVSIVLGIAAAVAVIAFVSVVTGGTTAGGNPLDGHQLGDLTLPSLEQGTVTAPWVSGHPTVVVMFASWCVDCKTELPRVAQYVSHHDLGDVRVMGIDVNDAQAAGLIFAEHAKVGFPIGFDAEGTVAQGTFLIEGLPDTVFVDANGIVNQVVQGSIQDRQLAAGIAAIS